MAISSAPFGVTRSGEAVTRFTLTNQNGMIVRVLDRGCIIQSIQVPTGEGLVDVALGYDSVQGYEEGSCFYGAFIGRYANRIQGSAFPLHGATVHLTPNEGKNHLHGVYASSFFYGEAVGSSLRLRRTSPAGEEGYPGELQLTVTYTLTQDNTLLLEYQATASEDTVVNLTNHTYFNLNGHDSGSALGHILQLDASHITPVDAATLPTGELLDVAGTPFDFRSPKPLGRDLDLACPQLQLAQGYDHNYVLDHPGMEQPFAVVVGDRTGITMTCRTTQPGVQLYSANYVEDDPAAGQGKGGAAYVRRGALCLETQHFPDSPNHPHFPSTLLRGGETGRWVTSYQFQCR